MPTLLVFDASPDPFWRMPASFLAALEQALAAQAEGEPWTLRRCHRGAELPAALRDADGFVGWPFPPALARRAPKLRFLHFLTAGVPAGWAAYAAKHPGVPVTRSSGINADGVAEHGLFLMLCVLRGLSVAGLSSWSPEAFLAARTPAAMRCGVVGTGPIGVELVRLLRPLFREVRVMGRRARPSEAAVCAGGVRVELGPVAGFDDAPAFFAEQDALVLALPATPESEALLAAPLFDALRPNALLVNLGRGESLDPARVAAFLDAHPDARFAADVAPTEPYPKEGLLYQHPRALLTPHVGGRRADVWEQLLPRALDALKTGLGVP